jgi:hypothetical protein
MVSFTACDWNLEEARVEKVLNKRGASKQQQAAAASKQASKHGDNGQARS